MTRKTNRQVLKNAVKELSDIDLVFFRARMLESCDQILNNKAEFINDHQCGIVSPHLIIECIENIKRKLEF